MDKLKFMVPDGVTGISLRGEQIDVTDGLIEVPGDLAPTQIDLLSGMGFVSYVEETTKKSKK